MNFHTEEYRGCRIRIKSDDHMECPLDDCDGVIMRVAHWHRRYNIGSSRGERIKVYASEWMREHKGPSFIVLPLRMIDHSGVDYSIGSNAYDCDPGGFDSGQVGFVWSTWQEARALLGGPLKTLRQRAIEAMTMELRSYNYWQAGWGAGYIAETKGGTEIASCWGFLPEDGGYAYAIRCAKESIDDYLSDPSHHEQSGEH